jgi:hypothetical protein
MSLETKVNKRTRIIADLIEVLDIPSLSIIYVDWMCGYCGNENYGQLPIKQFPISFCNQCRIPNTMPLLFRGYYN